MVGVAVNAPIGDLDELVGTGFGLSLRWGPGNPGATWTYRGAFAFDYFSSGSGPYTNIQFQAIGAELVHHSRPTFYQFGGLAQVNTRYTLRSSTGSQFTTSRYSSDFGLTGGVGVNFSRGGNKLFLEFAAMTVFTGSANSDWFPVRFGIRF
jgi:hypothetical protein